MVGRLQGPTADFATNGLPQVTSAVVQLAEDGRVAGAAGQRDPVQPARRAGQGQGRGSEGAPMMRPPLSSCAGARPRLRPGPVGLRVAAAQEQAGPPLPVRPARGRRGRQRGVGTVGGLPHRRGLPARGGRRPPADRSPTARRPTSPRPAGSRRPRSSVDEAVVAAFDANPGPVRLVTRGEPATADYVLRLDVRNFESRLRPGPKAAPIVVVRVRAAMTSRADRGLVAEKLFEKRGARRRQPRRGHRAGLRQGGGRGCWPRWSPGPTPARSRPA